MNENICKVNVPFCPDEDLITMIYGFLRFLHSESVFFFFLHANTNFRLKKSRKLGLFPSELALNEIFREVYVPFCIVDSFKSNDIKNTFFLRSKNFWPEKGPKIGLYPSDLALKKMSVT